MGARNGRGITLDEVARRAGVSRATVSRVVNGNSQVRRDARTAVERAVEELGYVPNAAARSLVTRRSDSIGVVITEPTVRLFVDPFFPRLLRGVGLELSGRGLQLVLVMPASADDERRAERYLTAGHLDGALLVSLHGDDPLPARLAAQGIPVVVGGRPPKGANVSFVDVDNRQGARSAVEHLLSLGRRRIATIGGPLDMSPGIDRMAGYREALEEAGIGRDRALEAVDDFTMEGGAAATARLLEAAPDFDGLFVASDAMAAGALRVLREAGRRVPDEVGVVGFDDSPIAATTEPPLSSIRQPIEDMGREMVRLLVEQLGRADTVPRRVILATTLVRRRSSEGVPRG